MVDQPVDPLVPRLHVVSLAVHVVWHRIQPDIGRLLDLVDQRVRPEAVQCSSRHIDRVSGTHRDPPHDGVVVLPEQRLTKRFHIDAVQQPDEDRRPGRGIEDMPCLGLAVRLVVHAPRRLVIPV